MIGHVHIPAYFKEANNINDIYCFTAGSNIIDGYAQSVFLTGSVNTDSGESEVVYHKWDESNEVWHIHNTVGRLTREGSYKFTLKKKGFKEVDLPSVRLDEDEFRNFLLEFHEILASHPSSGNFEMKDINDKFKNMLCSNTFKVQFDKLSVYFPIVDDIFNSPNFISFDKKFIVPNVIETEYMDLLPKLKDGPAIVKQMIENFYGMYHDKLEFHEHALKLYLRIVIYWSIHECDIFNDDKREVVRQ
ncbi:hypothetical protein BSO21_32615 [Paenibacillus odorifer]|uniref:Calcineurin-like phosphoesterase domain-containing protein n=1 Tax=Paenibacillus odorifer TaxID=189426 RepID=A0ABX3GFP7_9BACL|nr:hypothetical protein BSO21_32615 [Paenibacillus odorifer]